MNIFANPPKKIYCCGTYEPYWIKDDMGERSRNPKINRISRQLMDLKDENNRSNNTAVKDFSKLLSNRIKELGFNMHTKTQSGVAIIVVPSSQAGRVSPALERIASYAARQHNLDFYTPPVLQRTKTIQKLHSGGDRSISVHLSSIVVDDTHLTDLRYKRIIIIDDVSTTGGSLRACSQLLESAGIQSRHIELVSLLMTA
ncbi:ComF family protein [Vibrio ordalii]|uniref:Phosphoribosyltransferase domain-containing protein n=1 Tax=Vibrio ordalii FS-238 TaxID=617133 RepID=A0A853R5I2_9VIBR|nr:phosphoribosyltransferase family protein [Vibrio ordalii]OEE40750.1 hypothetical protein A1QS_13880 [Vibrio ordalii FS-238]